MGVNNGQAKVVLQSTNSNQLQNKKPLVSAIVKSTCLGSARLGVLK